MVWIDWFIIGVLIVSTCISLYRGFTREALSLITLALAIWLGIEFSPAVATLLETTITNPALRPAAAFGLIFLIALIVGAIINAFVGKVISLSGLGGLDRLLGIVFGAARGALVIVLILVVLTVTGFSKQESWKHSLFVPYFNQLVLEIAAMLPDFFEDQKKIIPVLLPTVSKEPSTTQNGLSAQHF